MACRVEVGGGEAASPSPAAVAMEAETLRVVCPARLPGLELPPPVHVGVEASRLLPDGEGLLVVADGGGLYRHTAGGTRRLLEGGRDYALAGERLARLEEDRIETFDYRSGEAPVPRARLPAQGHDVSVALLGGEALVHSAFNERALVLRRSLDDGAIQGALLPVRRNLFWSLLRGPEHLHEDEGLLLGEGPWLLHVPVVRDPVQALQMRTGRHWILELADGERGEVRLEGKTRREVQSCPGCPRRVKLSSGRVSVVPLYAGAIIDEDIFWILRLDPPGSSRAALLRVTVEAPEVRAWRLAFPTPPGALAVWRDSLAIAAGPDLWRVPLPEPRTGALCALDEGVHARGGEDWPPAGG
ncbi:MAG: hypothetical protein ACREMK_04175 [Gemmatimonadota bacterium]